MTKSLTKNSIFYLVYNVLNVVFPLISGIYISRVMSPEIVGTVTYSQNIVQYFVIFSFLGIPTYGMREVSKARNNRKELNKLFTELFSINLVSTIIFVVIYLTMILSVSSFRSNLPLYLTTGLLICFNAINISWLFEGEEEFGFISVRNVIVKFISFLFLVIFVKSDNDLLLYACVSVIGSAGNYVINLFYFPKFVHFNFNGLNFKRHLKPIISLVVVNLAIEIYSLIDVTMIGALTNKESVAFYSYASKIQKILLQIINTFTMVLVPRISLLYSESKYKEFNELISKTFHLILIVAFPMILGIMFVADDAVALLYGDAYIASADILRVLSMLVLISPIGYLLGSRVCLVTNNEKKMMFTVCLGAVINVIANYLFINYFGAFGAAVASLLSEITVMIVYVNFGRRFFKLEINRKSIISLIFASFVIGLFLSVISLVRLQLMIKLMIQVVGSVVLYFAVLIICKEKNICDFLRLIKK